MADTATTGGARHRGARWSWTFGPSQETVAPKERRYFFLRRERRRSRYRSTHAAVNCAFGPLFGHHCQPFSTMAVFHASPVSRISSDERHTWERSRSDVIRRSSHPSGCVTRMQRATFSPLRSVHASPSSIGSPSQCSRCRVAFNEMPRDARGVWRKEDPRRASAFDPQTVECQLRAKLEEWRGLLRRHVPQARQVLRKLLTGHVLFKPFRNGRTRHYEFSAPIGLGRILSGLACATMVASPTGFQEGRRLEPATVVIGVAA